MRRCFPSIVLVLEVIFCSCLATSSASAAVLVDIGGAPTDLVADPVRNEFYAALEIGHDVVRFNASGQITGSIQDPAQSYTEALAIAPDGSELYVAWQAPFGGGTAVIKVYDLPSLEFVTEIPLSTNNYVFSMVAGTDQLFANCLDGLAIIDLGDYSEYFHEYQTGVRIWTGSEMALSPDETRLYFTEDTLPFRSHQIIFYDVTTKPPTIAGLNCSDERLVDNHAVLALEISPDGSMLYAGGAHVSEYDNIEVFQASHDGLLHQIHTIPIQDAIGIVASSDGENLYVTSGERDAAVGDFTKHLYRIRTTDWLPYQVDYLQASTNQHENYKSLIALSSDNNVVAVSIYSITLGNVIELVDVSVPAANLGGIRLRPIDDLTLQPLGWVDTVLTLIPSGFVDIRQGLWGIGPVEPGGFGFLLRSQWNGDVNVGGTIVAGEWTDVGDIIMERREVYPYGEPRNVCVAEPVFAGDGAAQVMIYGQNFGPNVNLESVLPAFTIHGYSQLDWATIEATIELADGEPIGFSRGRFEASNSGGEAWPGQFFSAYDPPAVLAMAEDEVTVGEEEGTIELEVTRSGTSVGVVEVDYQTYDGTAMSAFDYTESYGTLVWQDGESDPQIVTVPITQDTDVEGPEDFTVRLSNPTGWASLSIHDDTLVTIADDDSSTVRLDAASRDVDEPDGTVQFTVSRTGNLGDPASVDWSTSDGTAVAGEDYTNSGATLDWAAGEDDDKIIEVPITDDSYPEFDESFDVELSGAGGNAFIAEPGSATVTIRSDDITDLLFSSPTFTASEGDGVATITVDRTGTINGAITIDYATAEGTATNGSDYSAVSGTLSWTDGDGTSKTFDVPLLVDTNAEPDETVLLTLLNPTGGASIGAQGTADLVIQDDDGTLLQFSTSVYNAPETGGSIEITVQRVGSDTSGAVSVDFATVDNTATAGLDYVAISGTLSWADAETDDKVFSVSIIDDGVYEGFETVDLELTDNTGNSTLGTPASGSIAIADDEAVEQLVNTITFQPQTRPDVSVSSSDESVVVWESYLQDGDGWGIFGQRFDAEGDPAGSEFQINAGSAGDQRNPTVVVRPDGGFTVVWIGSDDDDDGIFCRRFNATGAPVGGDVAVNLTTNGDQTAPDAAVDGSGAGLVVWQSDATGDLEIRGRRLDTAGAPTGSELTINSTTANDQQSPAIAGVEGGGFVATWQSYGQDGPAEGIIARVFAANGSPTGGEVVVNEWTAGNQISPAVDTAADGSFLVAWEDTTNKDGSGSSIRARWFSASAAPLGGDVQANTYWLDDQMNPTVICSGPGEAYIAWESWEQDGSNLGIYAQALGHDGSHSGIELRMNTFVDGIQHRPALADSPSGAFWATWASGAQDGSGDGIYGILSTAPVIIELFSDGFESGDTSAWSGTTP